MHVLVHSSIPALGYSDGDLPINDLKLRMELLFDLIDHMKHLSFCFCEADLYLLMDLIGPDLNSFFTEKLDLIDFQGVYSSNDIVRIIYSWFEVSPKLEERLETKDLIFDNDSISPRTLIDNFPTNVNDCFSSFLAKIIYDDLQNLCFGLAVCTSSSSANELVLSFDCIEAINEKCEITTNDPPLQKQGKLILLTSFSHYNFSSLSESLWSVAASNQDIKAAVYFRAKEYKSTLSYNDFSVGERFYDSLHNNSMLTRKSHASNTLNKCARLIAGIESPSDFRVNAQKNSPCITKKNDKDSKGKRLHLTERHEAYRLMAWQDKQGRFELANVGPKSELLIEE